MIWVILLVVLFFIIIIAVGVGSPNEKPRKSAVRIANDMFADHQKRLTDIGFISTRQLKDATGIIAIDTALRKVAISTNIKYGMRIIDFDNILDFQIDIDDETVYKRSALGAAGRAVAGGILLGGVGALIGGATTKSEKKVTIKSITLKLKIKDIKFPYAVFDFYPRGNDTPEKALKKAEEWKDVFEIAINN